MKTAERLLLISIFGIISAISAPTQVFPPTEPPTGPLTEPLTGPLAGPRIALTTGASDVRFISSFVPPGEPVPRECREEAHTFALSLVRYLRPEAWHWVVICDEAGWRRFLRFSGRDEGAAIYASTDLDANTTYIRGAKLQYPYDFQADPDAIIAHELAHIQLHTESEARADALARVWQQRARERLR